MGADGAFGGVRGFSKVIGAVDGTHIPVFPPKENRDAFINRKGWASLNVMLVCTHDCRILAVRFPLMDALVLTLQHTSVSRRTQAAVLMLAFTVNRPSRH